MRMQRYSLKIGPKREIKVMRPVPFPDDFWGSLGSLKGTIWESFIPIIPGMIYSHALHGYPRPLLEILGRPPLAHASKIPKEHRFCRLHGQKCLGSDIHCQPGPKVPDCYEAPGPLSEEARMAVALVVESWREGRYVIVIEGEEFSL